MQMHGVHRVYDYTLASLQQLGNVGGEGKILVDSCPSTTCGEAEINYLPHWPIFLTFDFSISIKNIYSRILYVFESLHTLLAPMKMFFFLFSFYLLVLCLTP